MVHAILENNVRSFIKVRNVLFRPNNKLSWSTGRYKVYLHNLQAIRVNASSFVGWIWFKLWYHVNHGYHNSIVYTESCSIISYWHRIKLVIRTLSFVFFLDDRFFGDLMLDLKLPFRGNLTIHDGGTIILLCLPENTNTGIIIAL